MSSGFEAAVPEPVPDRRKEDVPVSPVGGEHGHERQREEVGELGERDAAAHD
jgi:hypothetical protein